MIKLNPNETASKHLLQNKEEIKNVILSRIIQPTQQNFYNKHTESYEFLTAHNANTSPQTAATCKQMQQS